MSSTANSFTLADLQKNEHSSWYLCYLGEWKKKQMNVVFFFLLSTSFLSMYLNCNSNVPGLTSTEWWYFTLRGASVSSWYSLGCNSLSHPWRFLPHTQPHLSQKPFLLNIPQTQHGLALFSYMIDKGQNRLLVCPMEFHFSV